jgi:F-type H+-transporting ATPase subunit a
MEHQPEKSFFERYKGLLYLGILVLIVAFFCGVLPNLQANVLGIAKAARPVIALPAEKILETPLIDLGDPNTSVYLTNTLIATLIVDALLIIVALIARAGLKEVPGGFSQLVELLVEFLYNQSEQVMGSKWGRRIFPIAATIFLFLLLANWMELIPGVDSIGVMRHPAPGEASFPVGQWGSALVYSKVDDPGGTPAPAASASDEKPCAAGDMCVVVPYVRAAATDLNVPLALAIISFLTIQVFGVLSLKWGYPAKFVNAPALGRGGMGIMDFGVGLFELVLEPFKIVSLTFRLLGNIFGGGVLLLVVISLVAFLVPVPLYAFELFVGAIQAYVFFILTLVFSAGAMAGHGGEDHH